MQNFTNHLKLHVGSLKTVDTYVNVVKNFFNSYKEFKKISRFSSMKYMQDVIDY